MDHQIRAAERALAADPHDHAAKEKLRAALTRAGLADFTVEYSLPVAPASARALDADGWAMLCGSGWTVDPHRRKTWASLVVRAASPDEAVAVAKLAWEQATGVDPCVESCLWCDDLHTFNIL